MAEQEEIDQLSNHIPWLPDPTDNEIQDANNYNAIIASLPERSELSIHPIKKSGFSENQKESRRQNKSFFNHQIGVRRALYWGAPVRTCLVKWSPGTGKTAVAAVVSESFHERLSTVIKSDDRLMKSWTGKAIIIAPNDAIIDQNFKSDIFKVSEGTYLTERLKHHTYRDIAGEKRGKTVSINKNYTLYTHRIFAKKLKSMTDEEIAVTFSFTTIVFDEAQAVKEVAMTTMNDDDENYEAKSSTKSKKITVQFHRLVVNVYGSTIIVMTATPIVNDVNEFPSVANLILPKGEKIDPVVFKAITSLTDRVEMKRQMEAYLVPKLLGRVSCINITQGISKTLIRSNSTPKNQIESVYTHNLWASFISHNNPNYSGYDPTSEKLDYSYLINTYNMAANMKEDSSFHGPEIYSSTMVFPSCYPPGTCGTTEYGLLGIKAAQQFIKTTEYRSYHFTEEFMADFRYYMNYYRFQYISMLTARIQKAEASMNANNQQRLKEEIDVNRQYIEYFQKRIQDNPSGTFDHTDDADLIIMLRVIRARYSPVFADTIESIIGIEYKNIYTGEWEILANSQTNYFNPDHFDEADKDNRECVFVYNKFKYPGIVSLGCLLELFGIMPLDVTKKSEFIVDGKIGIPRAKRYVLLYSSDSDTQHKPSNTMAKSMTEIINLFNHPDNKYGHYLKVLLGTAVTALGINFTNVRQAHFTYQGWNIATNLQTETRVDRPGSSHQAFTEKTFPIITIADPNPDAPIGSTIDVQYGVQDINGPTGKYVKVYRRIAYFVERSGVDLTTGKPTNTSIAIKMYDDAVRKEELIFMPIEIVNRVAFDGIMNQPDPNNQFKPYAFDGFEKIKPDYANYNLLYARNEIEFIKCNIRTLFQKFYRLKLSEISQKIKKSNIFTIIKALTEMIKDNERIFDRYGVVNYLREENDIFFLQRQSRGLKHESEQWLSYYSSLVYFRDGRSLTDMYNDSQRSIAVTALNQLTAAYRENNETKFQAYIRGLSDFAKSYMIEYMVSEASRLLRSGETEPRVFDEIFKRLYPNVAYGPQNQVILHTFELRDRNSRKQGTSGNYLSINKGEMVDIFRMFSIAEGKWRTSNRIESERFKNFFSKSVCVNTSHISCNDNFAFYGTSYISNNTHVFKTARRDKGGNSDLNNAQSEYCIGFLHDVTVNIYAMIELYKVDNMFEIAMIRYIEDPNATAAENPIYCSGKVLKPYLRADRSKCILFSSTKINRSVAPLSVIMVNYTKPYPEILAWIFENEAQNADTSVVNGTNPTFFPTFYSQSKTASKDSRYYLTDLKDLTYANGAPRKYHDALDMMPRVYEYSSLGWVLLYRTEPNRVDSDIANRMAGLILSSDSNIDPEEFTHSSIIYMSLRKMIGDLFGTPDRAAPFGANYRQFTPIDIVDRETKTSTNLKQNVFVGRRFYEIYSILTLINIKLLIYLLYFLRGSVIFDVSSGK